MSEACEGIRAVRFSIDLDGGALTGWRWRNWDKPPLLFLHATGFCASAYRQMLTPVSEHFDVFALDLRGHGDNSLPALPANLRSWRPYVEDVRAFLNVQSRAGWVLSGHSLGAATALMASQARKDVAALKLIEPVAIPEWMSVLAKTPIWPLLSPRIKLVRLAARRRAVWPDRQSAFSAYSRKGLFKSWAPGVLGDYLEDGLKEDAEGGDGAGSLTLACSPEWEAATFAAQGNDFWRAARSVRAPISIFAADHPSSTLPLAARRRFGRLGASVLVKDGVSHLAPMENPQDLAGFVVA
ncbi:alpha/beta fold hydrolase [Hyphococcus sp.]|uniref:alpha/beta fold hydrolase n=1 Tax=Hyphococcus sp. TaxID=2038636 RepID=UPI002089505E|nr:MAG: hypothetical protein DHS20C04_06730 [Marinicaulis sp.]